MRAAPPRSTAAGDNQRGSVTMSFAFFLPLLCGAAIAALVISRQALERRELQSAADALALAGAYSLEQLGTPAQWQVAAPVAALNARLPVTPTFTFERRLHENRTVVRVEAALTFDSQQSWFKKRYFDIRVVSHAQINENVFGDRWPAMTFVLDASQSMSFPLLGSNTTSAFAVVQQLVIAYAANTLPVRNGVVIFNDAVVSAADPPLDNVNNLAAIQAAFQQAAPVGLTNARAGLDRARAQLTALTGGRNVVFISDGEPTLGGACPAQGTCHFEAGVQAASQLRNLAADGVALFTVEIRRSNYWSAATEFLQRIAGEPLSEGNDPAMAFQAQSQLGIAQFITGLTRSICAFGPLTPRPGSGPDALRPRASNPDPMGNPRRIFAFLREANGVEMAIPAVQNRDLVPAQPGFEYMSDATGAFVILTLASCNALGADPTRRLVVRWDDAQLVPPP